MSKITDEVPVNVATAIQDGEALKEYIRNHPPGPFKPLPYKNVRGNQIEWYFSDEEGYAEAVYVDGIQVGSVIRSVKTKEVVGVKIFVEAIK